VRSRNVWCAALLIASACKGDTHDTHDAHDASHDPHAPPTRDATTTATHDLDATPATPAAPPLDERDEHAVFDLGDNRLLAHRLLDGDLVVDAGSAGFARYTRFGLPAPRWDLRALRDGVRAAVPDRLASLDLPLTEEQAVQSSLILMRVWAAAPRTIAVKVNGRKADEAAGSVQLEAGWQTIAVGVAKGRWAPGENQIVIETTAAKTAKTAKASKRTKPPKPPTVDDRIALAWLRLSPAPQASDLDPRATATYDPVARRFALTSGAGLAYYALVPDGAHLVARVAGDGCRVDVTATANDGAFAAGMLTAATTRVDLSTMGGRVVRLELRARDCPVALIDGARITIPGPEPRVGARGGAPPQFWFLFFLWISGPTSCLL
jgi:hypothetical protein